MIDTAVELVGDVVTRQFPTCGKAKISGRTLFDGHIGGSPSGECITQFGRVLQRKRRCYLCIASGVRRVVRTTD